MTTTVAAPPRGTTRTLAALEARLLLRGPMLWVGVVLAVALSTTWGWTQ